MKTKINHTEKIEINNSAWFRHWFDSSFYHQLYGDRDEREAANFIDELLVELTPTKGATMLDLGCGNGRHSKYLASKGFQVTGLDLAASSIRMAKKFQTSNLNFYRHDMRLPFGNNRFDYVLNFFTSFGYFKSDHENYQVISNMANSLVEGGVLIIDYLNAPFAEQNLISAEKKEIDGVIYDIERWTDERFFFKKITIGNMEYTEQVARLSLSDFDFMLSKNGLQIERVFGDYCLKEYSYETSPRLILVARKSG